MKKYLLSLLALVALIPSANSIISESYNHNKAIKHQQEINKLTADNKKYLDENGKINWKEINNKVDNNITKIDTSLDNKVKLESQVKKYTDNFDSKHSTLQQANQYFINSNKKFSDNFTNDNKNFTKITNRIINEYFSSVKTDLNLMSTNTYQDAINNLENRIKNQYQNSDIKISLVDTNLAETTLFSDDSNDLAKFIENNISMEIKVEINGQKLDKLQTLSLTNIQINPETQAQQLKQCLGWYFNNFNPQDLNLTATSTRSDALNALVKKISTRFNIKIGNNINSNSGIQMTVENTSRLKTPFLNDPDLGDVINQNFWFDVQIKNNFISQSHYDTVKLFLSNIKFNFVNMIIATDQLFLSSQKFNVNLGLDTDNTFQDVANKLSERLNQLNSDGNWYLTLVDSSQAKTTLNSEYNPAKSENTFSVALNFNFKEGNQIIKIGSANVYLGNVTPGEQAKKSKELFDKYVAFMAAVKAVYVGLSIAATTFSVLSAAFWAGTFLQPELSVYAWTCTVASCILTAATIGFGTQLIAIQKYANNWEALWNVGRYVIKPILLTYGYALWKCWTGTAASLSTMSYNYFILTASFTLAGLAGTLYLCIDYFKS